MIYKLYKRIMKRDLRAIDEIKTLEEAKEIINLMTGNVYLNGELYRNKYYLVHILREVAFCVVEEINNEVNCTKNRFGDRTMDDCKDYEFEIVKLSELNGTSTDISNIYYGKNVWLILE